jgi:hypothetical protein
MKKHGHNSRYANATSDKQNRIRTLRDSEHRDLRTDRFA